MGRPRKSGSGTAKLLKMLRNLPARRCVYCVENLSGSLADAVEWSPVIWGASAMQQVADWLEKLGLGQYVEWFDH
jgi:hypothetical protein